ncbi:NrfD/PsrC family molybdoenzyme membrane anchor subunit [Adlercreutzia sp. ZJ473]|uniref:NrfD/PsrC family molybdoenzyme membrane anchor subunit n=1 Tax=Adlercreutzia sp. ZJ473 TaxID=2722822 RepID=UPI0015526720|nr:NrfD/PsrC family molybdoenzyme membrane anchor subunit [Adlercreutzia sp. ZJ473]
MSNVKTSAAGAHKPLPRALIIVLAVLTAIGLGCWFYSLAAGLEVGGVSNVSPWGIYITVFMTFVGLSAGGLIVASSAHVFNIEPFKKVALPAVIMSTVCICAALGFIIVDLRNPANMWRLFTGPNPVSPLTWDVIVIFTYLVINIIDIVLLVRGDERKVSILSRIALPVAILVHSVTAWIFSLQVARTWYTAIMAPIFVVSACDSGLALLILGLVCLEALGWFTAGRELIKSLAGLLATFIAVDAFLIACELLTMGYPGAAEAEALSVILTGAAAPYFWLEAIGGLLIPFCILVFAKNRENTTLVVVSSALVVLGVLCKRVWLLFSGFAAPYAENSPVVPGWLHAGDAASMGGLAGFYAPSVFEILVTIGIVALFTLVFLVLCNKLLGARAEANTQ